MNPTDYERQLKLEQEGLTRGIETYRQLVATSATTELPPGTKLLKMAITKMYPAVCDLLFKNPRGGRLAGASAFFRTSGLRPEEVAYITCRSVLNQAGEQVTETNLALDIMRELLLCVEYRKFKQAQPHLLTKIEQDIKKKRNAKSRARIIFHAKRLVGVDDEHMSLENRLKCGVKLLETFISTTGLVAKKTIVRHRRGEVFVVLTEATMQWLEQGNASCELLNPWFMPMVCPPRPWSSLTEGGYYTFRNPLIRTHFLKHLRFYEGFDLTDVFRTVNTIQSTGWQINKPVLDVFRQALLSGTGLGQLPITNLDLPPKWWDTVEEFEHVKKTEPERLKEWRRQTAYAHDNWARNQSKRTASLSILSMAERFANEPTIWFPYNCDFRGRVYPLARYLHPQGDDSCRGLLRFTEGKRLGPRGGYWLKVHLANCFGVDKVSFDDRVAWVDSHAQEIVECANNPMDGSRMWSDADAPFQFLAAALEFADYQVFGEDFVSHLSIQMDGTCNGLQHLSALVRDEVGGAAVNLIPSPTPSDIYSVVAGRTNEKVAEDLKSNDDEVRHLATLWSGKVDRSMAKRNTMTVPYGVTKFGMVDQLADEVRGKGANWLGEGASINKACQYLGQKNWEAIEDVVVSANKVMGWLRACAQVANQYGVFLRWVTPSGFVVVQNYTAMQSRRITTYSGSIRVTLSITQPTAKLSGRKQVMGISPNFIHALDASHLMLTVRRLADDHGISSFCLVHDSYGVHAADVDTLNEALRAEFVDMYASSNPLANMVRDLKTLLPEEAHAQLPPIPSFGKLDIEAVRQSKYFFA